MSRAVVLATLHTLVDQTGWPPSERQVAQAIGCAPSTAHKYMAELRTIGRLRYHLVSVASRNCGHCGAALDGRRADAHYCCDSHRAQAWKEGRAA